MGEKQNKKQKWYSISVDKKKKHAEINLFGVVGSYRLNIHTFQDELAPYKDLKTIKVLVSTLGGTFNDGLPIYNILKQHKAEITTVNMGYALSMGSVIMLAGDKRESAQNALQMLHSPNRIICDYVNAHDLRSAIKPLEAHEASLMPRYQEVMGLSATAIKKILKEETWYTADQAKKAGLIHTIIDPANLDAVADSMTENSVEDTIKMMSHQPPQEFMDRICSQYPDAIEKFKNLKPTSPSDIENGDQSEDDDMTPEQLQELKDSLTAAITAAVKEEVEKASTESEKKLTTALENKFSALAENPSTLIVSKLDEGLAATKLLTEAQESQDDAIAAIAETVTEVKNLPVNKQRLEQHGNRENNDGADNENKATWS